VLPIRCVCTRLCVADATVAMRVGWSSGAFMRWLRGTSARRPVLVCRGIVTQGTCCRTRCPSCPHRSAFTSVPALIAIGKPGLASWPKITEDCLCARQSDVASTSAVHKTLQNCFERTAFEQLLSFFSWCIGARTATMLMALAYPTCVLSQVCYTVCTNYGDKRPVKRIKVLFEEN